MERQTMNRLDEMKNIVLGGGTLSKDDALELCKQDILSLAEAADEIRDHFCGQEFDLCTIINGKSGKCSENCKYCAQSSFYGTAVEEYPLLDTKTIVENAKYNEDRGVLRYSIVTSGKRLSDPEVEKMCESISEIRQKTNVSVCASFGLLDQKAFSKLKEAGVSRIHNNLETSRKNFPNVCTTHSYDDKIEAIRAAKEAGLEVCSGGIIGLGETMEVRIDMALSLRELGIRSVPVNILAPIPGTPYASKDPLGEDEICRTLAIFRFLLPSSAIRLAGGRGLLADKGKQCFLSGANAAITGDMLTTAGITIEQDLKMIKELNFKVVKTNE